MSVHIGPEMVFTLNQELVFMIGRNMHLLPIKGHIYLALIEAKGLAHNIEAGDAGKQLPAHSCFSYVFGRLSVRWECPVLDDQLKYLLALPGLSLIRSTKKVQRPARSCPSSQPILQATEGLLCRAYAAQWLSRHGT